MFDTEEIRVLDGYIDSFMQKQLVKYKGNATMEDKINHIHRCNMLIALIAKDNPMALLGCKYHDIGRFLQYERLGKFDDKTLPHNLFGEFFIQQEIRNGNLRPSYELDTLRLVSMYHGLEDMIPEKTQLSQEVLDCIKAVSIVDRIDNGCVGALGYLEREVRTDAKNFAATHPELDMKSVTPEVFAFFARGEIFDKNKYCRTYADYILFACLLAISSLKGEYHMVAKSAMMQRCYKYDNALVGYKDLFDRFVESRYASICYQILLGYYMYSGSYEFGRENCDNDRSGQHHKK